MSRKFTGRAILTAHERACEERKTACLLVQEAPKEEDCWAFFPLTTLGGQSPEARDNIPRQRQVRYTYTVTCSTTV